MTFGSRQKRVVALALAWALCATVGFAAATLRYGADDLAEVAKNPGHPMAEFVRERLQKRAPLPQIWIEAASQYAEEGRHADAWAIQIGVIRSWVTGREPLSNDAAARVVKDMAAQPARFRKWEDLETELFGLFQGRQTSHRAAEVFAGIVAALDAAGANDKALAFAKRGVDAAPNDALGVAALNAMPASAAFCKEVAEKHGETRAGVVARLKLGAILMRQNDLAGAGAAYAAFLEKHPASGDAPKALEALIDICCRRRDFASALAYSEELLKHVAGADAIAVAERMARIHAHTQNRKRFVAAYRDIGERYGIWHPMESAQAIFAGGEHAKALGWADEAAELYDLCVCLIGQVNNLPLADLPRSQGDAEERVGFWKLCLNAAGEQEGRFDRILAFVKRHPRSREAAYGRYLLAGEASRQRRFQEALEHAEAALALLPEAQAVKALVEDTRVKAGRVGQAHQERRAAEDSLARADVRGLSGAEAIHKLAHFHARAGRFKEALENLDALAREWPESPLAPRALFDMAMLYRNDLQQREQWRESMERLLVLYPETELGVSALQLLSRTAKQ